MGLEFCAKAIGHLEVVPGSMLPSAGEGTWSQAVERDMKFGSCEEDGHLMTKPRIVRVQMNAKLSGEASGMLIPEFLGDCMWVVGWDVVTTRQNGRPKAHTFC